MIMQEHSRRLAEAPQWTRAGRWAAYVIALSLGIAILVAAILAAGGSFNHRLGTGCIEARVASTTGGARISGCGAMARAICAEPGTAAVTATGLRESCKRAGFAFDVGHSSH